ncbi:DNA circularization N-terminal domain-containing protein [Lysobacter sp. LF1]|uniref:DNA circularization N-terminal domain-containing protein n=1 Tax=Lysobacter stagni TaxID=3045172 RepID=A0ABT6XKP4_9GAMM|nr:DNA circularization N-terminal domain-containing protein [Lysobacter sp. LF1]MDI9240734.1 DNA circularization N-terminal domain-containing protein [Lysobacter sp. LF1]
MSWRDHYRTASFRGVEFRVDGHKAGYGRRQVVHEYAQRDTPFTEDLGRKPREFSVDGYVVGLDYHLQRDRIIDACEVGGPGELVHPYRGSLHVVCTGLSVQESKSEGGIAYLSFSFVEAGEARYPADSVDGVSSVSSAAQGVLDAAQSAFGRSWSTAGMPSFVANAAAAHPQSLSAFFARVLTNPLDAVQNVAGFARQVQQLADQALSLADEPLELATKVVALITRARTIFGAEAGTVLRDLQATFPVLQNSRASTAARQQEASNAAAFASLVRAAALAERTHHAVVTAASGGFATHEDAVTERAEISAAIDEEMESPGLADPVFVALSTMGAEAVRGIPSPGQRLPQLVAYVPPSTLPTLVLAHRLYGTAERAIEIVARNRIAHPGFVPGGVALQVLGNG